MSRKIIINHNQLALPFGEVASLKYEDRERAFWFLVCASILSLVVYFYGINATARNVAQRGELEARVGQASGELATLEFEYIALKNGVTAERASALGFEEVKSPLFVTRGEGSTLSFNTERE